MKGVVFNKIYKTQFRNYRVKDVFRNFSNPVSITVYSYIPAVVLPLISFSRSTKWFLLLPFTVSFHVICEKDKVNMSIHTYLAYEKYLAFFPTLD